jgi:hypothetical protein
MTVRKEVAPMARIVVQADDNRILWEERSVKPAHIEDEHSAEQLLERLEWALRAEPRSRRRRRSPIAAPPEQR